MLNRMCTGYCGRTKNGHQRRRGEAGRLPGGGGGRAVKEENEWPVMGIFQAAGAKVPHF